MPEEPDRRPAEAHCPHCGGGLRIDVASGTVEKAAPPGRPAKGGKSSKKRLDEALGQVRSREQGGDEAFESAFSSVRNRGKDFDEKFTSALQNVDPDGPPPPNIFDLEDGRIPPPRSFDDEDEDDDADDDADSEDDADDPHRAATD